MVIVIFIFSMITIIVKIAYFEKGGDASVPDPGTFSFLIKY